MSLQRRESKRSKSSGRGANAKYLYSKQVRLPNGMRSTIQLGALAVKDAEEIGGLIDELLAAARHGVAIDASTRAWLLEANKSLLRKLADLGLCELQSDPLVTEADYIARKSVEWAQGTITNFKQI